MIDENQLFEMMLDQNLSCITMFHNHLDAALKDKLPEIDQNTELDKGYKNFWKREYEINYPEKLRETSFVLMFGHLEEMLFLLWRDNNPDLIPLDKGHGVTKFKTYIKSTLGNLHENIDYRHIIDAQKIRNSFLHIAGRVSLSRDSEVLNKLAKQSKFYSIKMDRIKIEYEGLKALRKAISNLTKALLNK